jgi:exonuclease III
MTAEKPTLSSKQNTATRAPTATAPNRMFDYTFNKVYICEVYYPNKNVDKVLTKLRNKGSRKFVKVIIKEKQVMQKSVAPGSPRRRVFKKYQT